MTDLLFTNQMQTEPSPNIKSSGTLRQQLLSLGYAATRRLYADYGVSLSGKDKGVEGEGFGIVVAQ